MKKFKKEKYINQRQLKNGWSFQVIIRKDNHTIIETFNEVDYRSPRVAYDSAIKFRNHKLTELSDKKYHANDRVTLGDVFELSEVLSNINHKTHRNHLTIFNKFIGDRPLDEFTTEFIIMLLNKMTNNYSNDYISRVFNVCKQIDNTALLKGYYYSPRTIGLKAPKSRKINILKKERITDADTICTILENLNDKYIRGILITAFYTGMRPAEIFALSSADIKDNKIYVNKQIGSNANDEGVVRNTKTEDSTRIIPIAPGLKPFLSQFKGHILFKNVDGGYFTANKFSSRTRRLFASYSFNLYMVRHLFATTLEYSGVDRVTIDKLMGHSPRNSTDIYVHTNEDKMIRAVSMLNLPTKLTKL